MTDYDDNSYEWAHQQEIEHRHYEETIMSSTVRANVDHLVETAIAKDRRCKTCRRFINKKQDSNYCARCHDAGSLADEIANSIKETVKANKKLNIRGYL